MHFKKYFVTGLAILLPVTLTLVVVAFVFNLLTEPFLGLAQAILGETGLLHTGLLFLSAEQLQTLLSQFLILIVLFFFTVSLGLFARRFFIRYIIHGWDYIIHRIPFIRTIYKACQDVITTIFGSKTSAFKQVVMVRFPSQDTQTIGLITREELPGLERLGSDLVVVFVPTTPNPTSGFLTIVKRSDVVPLDMKVEDAFKYVISCGVIMPSLRKEKGTVVNFEKAVNAESFISSSE